MQKYEDSGGTAILTVIYKGLKSLSQEKEAYCEACFDKLCVENNMTICDECNLTDYKYNMIDCCEPTVVRKCEDNDKLILTEYDMKHKVCPNNYCGLCAEEYNENDEMIQFWETGSNYKYCHRKCVEEEHYLCRICKKGIHKRCMLCALEGVKCSDCTCCGDRNKMQSFFTSSKEIEGEFCAKHCDALFKIISEPRDWNLY